jgi:hypothetical protein
MFLSVGKEIKDKILTGELSNFVSNNRALNKGKLEATQTSKKNGCC